MGLKFKQIIDAKKRLDDRLSRLLIREDYKDLNLKQIEHLIDIALPFGYYSEWQPYLQKLIKFYQQEYSKVGSPTLVAQLEEAGTYIERQSLCL